MNKNVYSNINVLFLIAFAQRAQVLIMLNVLTPSTVMFSYLTIDPKEKQRYLILANIKDGKEHPVIADTLKVS